MTNIPPETDNYDTHKIWCLQKWHTLQKMLRGYLSKAELSDFSKESLKFVV